MTRGRKSENREYAIRSVHFIIRHKEKTRRKNILCHYRKHSMTSLSV